MKAAAVCSAVSFEIPATTGPQGLKGHSKPLRAVEQLAPGPRIEVGLHQLLACSEGESEVCHVSDAGCCAPFTLSPPARDKDTNNVFPRSSARLLLWFPYKNRAGSYFREPSSGWLQPVEPTFFSPVLFNN